MPRSARLEIPNVPLHIIQRGVNRCAVFIDEDDRRHYLNLLQSVAKDHEIAVHAYVLMGNHNHLLLTSRELGTISKAMQRLSQCYVQAFNKKHGRTGTLWDGRFKSSLVDSETYLLVVYRYIELNPVRAAISDAPEHYLWSSAQGNLGLRYDPILTPHPVFKGLASDSKSRVRVYADWLQQGICEEDLDTIRAYIQQEKVLGSTRFRDMVERTLGCAATWHPRGRPRSDAKNSPKQSFRN
jgi:putative transposase